MNRGGTSQDEQLIRRGVSELRAATDLPLTFGGVVSGCRQVRLTEFAGATVGALRGVALDFGRGLGGKAVQLRRPVVVNDYVQAPVISHHYDRIIQAEGLRAMAAVPVVVGRVVRGVLYGSIRTDIPLGDRTIQSAVDIARELEQRLAVQDELDRRMAWLCDYAAAETSAGTPQTELIREATAQLRILAAKVADPKVRDQVDLICHKLAGVPTGPNSTVVLSRRELDVLSCVALGWTNRQVAADLEITAETVKSYLRSAMRKLGAQSRLQAAANARRLGLLP